MTIRTIAALIKKKLKEQKINKYFLCFFTYNIYEYPSQNKLKLFIEDINRIQETKCLFKVVVFFFIDDFSLIFPFYIIYYFKF